MTKFKIVFRDGYSVEQEAEIFSVACVLAAYKRVMAGDHLAKQLLIDEKRCGIEKKNYCDADGKCTAEDHDELIGCRFYTKEEITRPEMCISLSKLGDICLHPDALTAKLKELQAAKQGPQSIADPRDSPR